MITNIFTPPNQIKEIYYINIDTEKDRNAFFLENYQKSKLKVPLHRTSGIIVKKGNSRLKRGQLGCALSHIEVMKKISKKSFGWYLVCEDDCTGDFKAIERKVRCITSWHPFLHFINLFNPRTKNIRMGTGSRTTAYLVTPLGAGISYKIIENNLQKQPCDFALDRSFIHLFIAVRFHKILYPNGMPSNIKSINSEKADE